MGEHAAMEKLEVVTEAEEDEEKERVKVHIPENPVPQIPALVRIPLCPPPIPPPPVPTGSEGGIGDNMWVRARRSSVRKDSCVSSSEDEAGGVAELIRKSSVVLGQLIRVDDREKVVEGTDDDDDTGKNGIGGGGGQGAQELWLNAASTKLSELDVSVKYDKGPRIILLSTNSLGWQITGEEKSLGAGNTILSTASAGTQKRAKLRPPSSITRPRKKSTLASKWRKQRERQRLRESSPLPELTLP